MKANDGDRQSKRAASCEKNDADAETFYPLFNPKSKKMKETMESVVKESAEMHKNGTLVGDNQKCSCTECNSTFEFNFSAPNNSKNGPFAHASNAMTSFVAIVCAVALNFHAISVSMDYAENAVSTTKKCSDVMVAASPRATRFSTGVSPALHLLPTNMTTVCRFAKSVALGD